MEFQEDWAEDEEERFSGDSDGFDEDSVCSWLSEPESLCNVWRGWKKQGGIVGGSCSGTGGGGGAGGGGSNSHVGAANPLSSQGGVCSLIEQAAKVVAAHIPFEVERFPEPVPEQLQLRIAFWSFPQHEEDIRLYSCLACGSADEFQKGEILYKYKTVKDALQIGYHLSAVVVPPEGMSWSPKGAFKVSVLFDRRKITECYCTCNEGEAPTWCQHIVAVCLHRIYQAVTVALRAPVSETLLRLDRDQLQKFAQYLIDASPQQILPTAQRLLDELLSSTDAAINKKNGAPDPTAGPSSASDRAMWYMNERALRENVKKTMVKFCAPAPMVLSDLNCLSSSAPPAANEWQLLLRPLRGREPEGIWNLLSIVRELFRRQDTNAVQLLDILTEEMTSCEQLLVWWYNVRVSPAHNSIGLTRSSAGGGSSTGGTANSNANTAQSLAGASLCDEVVALWRLHALAPMRTVAQRAMLAKQFEAWHRLVVDKISKGLKSGDGRSAICAGSSIGGVAIRRLPNLDMFPGFKPALEATLLAWDNVGDIDDSKHGPAKRSLGGSAVVTGTGECSVVGDRRRAPSRAEQHRSSAIPQDLVSEQLQQPVPSRPHGQDQQYPEGAGAGTSVCLETGVAAAEVEVDMSSGIFNTSKVEGSWSNATAKASAVQVASSAELGPNFNSLRQAVQAPTAVRPTLLQQQQHQHQQQQLLLRQEQQRDQLRQSPMHGCGTDADVKPDDSDPATCDDLAAYAEDRDDSSDLGARDGNSSSSSIGAIASSAAVGYPSSPAEAVAALTETTSDELREYYLSGMRLWTDPKEVLFARVEALTAHGLAEEACRLASELAQQLLAEADSLAAAAAAVPLTCAVTYDVVASDDATSSGTGRRKCATVSLAALQQQLAYAESFAATTLAKAAFLCVTLLDGSTSYHHLAFRIGMFGLEMPRPPAANKALEVKLANQESELAAVLRRMPLASAELEIIRDRAQLLRENRLRPRGDAHLPLTLASFIFESLCLPVGSTVAATGAVGSSGGSSRPPSRSAAIVTVGTGSRPVAACRQPGDERLGFEAAVTVLGMKMTVAEAEHPLLCEGARRQRGELAVAMLVHYKDDYAKLDVILSRLLDRDIYPHFKTPSVSCYLSSSATSSSCAGGSLRNGLSASVGCGGGSSAASAVCSPGRSALGAPAAADVDGAAAGLHANSDSTCGADEGFGQLDEDNGRQAASQRHLVPGVRSPAASRVAAHPRQGTAGRDGHALSTGSRGSGGGGDTDGSALDDDDYKELDAKLRCSLYRTNRKHSTGMAAIDSSAPETTSSDNSPTTSRRPWPSAVRPHASSAASQQQHHHGQLPQHQQYAPVAVAATAQGACGGGGAGSDSESSGKSSDSLGSRCSGRLHATAVSAAATTIAGAAVAPAFAPRQHQLSSGRSAVVDASGSSGNPAAFSAEPGIGLSPQQRVVVSVSGGAGSRGENESLSLRYVSQYGPFSNDTKSTTASRSWQRHPRNRLRQQPTVPNQPSEALSHFMFELARLVLSKAGGSSSTSLFTPQQAVAGVGRGAGATGVAADGVAAAAAALPAGGNGTGSGPHRALHLCAFQIGLYSLGIHNCTSPNWLSRTYSSHVSWITGQATEIGSAAISVLIDMWEGHLTPPEVVVLADKASRGRDPHMAQHAAELALSCLPHAHTLNPSEIQRALQQCKEQGQRMLERACLAVESAAKDGGVYPEVLFDVAHKWYELYEENGSGSMNTSHVAMSAASAAAAATVAAAMPGIVAPITHDGASGLGAGGDHFSAVIPLTTARPYTAVSSACRQGPLPPYHSMIAVPPPPGALHHAVEHMSQAVPPYHQFYSQPPPVPQPPFHQPPPSAAAIPYHPMPYAATIVPCTFQFPPPPGYVATGYAYSSAPPLHILQQQQQQPPPQLPLCGYSGSTQHGAFPSPAVALAGPGGLAHAYAQVQSIAVMGPPAHAVSLAPMAAAAAAMSAAVSHHHHQQQQQLQPSPGGIMSAASSALPAAVVATSPGNERHAYLVSAYRVGLLAIETLGRRVHDERPQVKYARNPAYREDVKWLLGLSMKLGHGYVQQFCQCAVSSLVNPFVLQDIVNDVTQLVLRTHTHVPAHAAVRTPTLSLVVQRCLQMYVQCTHQRINHIQPADYEEFVTIIVSARAAFLGNNGAAQFNEMMSSLKRHKSCKKELWQRIMNAMQAVSTMQ